MGLGMGLGDGAREPVQGNKEAYLAVRVSTSTLDQMHELLSSRRDKLDRDTAASLLLLCNKTQNITAVAT